MISSKVNELRKQKSKSEAASTNYWVGQKVQSEGGKQDWRTTRMKIVLVPRCLRQDCRFHRFTFHRFTFGFREMALFLPQIKRLDHKGWFRLLLSALGSLFWLLTCLLVAAFTMLDQLVNFIQRALQVLWEKLAAAPHKLAALCNGNGPNKMPCWQRACHSSLCTGGCDLLLSIEPAWRCVEAVGSHWGRGGDFVNAMVHACGIKGCVKDTLSLLIFFQFFWLVKERVSWRC